MRILSFPLALPLALAFPLQAQSPYETGFEPPSFAAGSLHGQDGWTGSGASAIQSATTSTGNHALYLDASAGFAAGERPIPSPVSTNVYAEVQVRFLRTGTASPAARSGIAVNGNSGAVTIAQLSNDGSGGYTINNATGSTPTRQFADGVWHVLHLRFAFLNNTVTGWVDGQLLGTLGGVPVTSISSVVVFAHGGVGPHSAYFDELTVSSSNQRDGNECTVAILVGDATNGTFTTNDNNAGTAGDDTSCGSNDTVDEWYVYWSTTTGFATASIRNAGGPFDSTLGVFDGCGSGQGGNELTCNDNGYGCRATTGEASVTWSVVAGTPYRIRVAGVGFTSGSYDLLITPNVPQPGNVSPLQNPIAPVLDIDFDAVPAGTTSTWDIWQAIPGCRDVLSAVQVFPTTQLRSDFYDRFSCGGRGLALTPFIPGTTMIMVDPGTQTTAHQFTRAGFFNFHFPTPITEFGYEIGDQSGASTEIQFFDANQNPINTAPWLAQHANDGPRFFKTSRPFTSCTISPIQNPGGEQPAFVITSIQVECPRSPVSVTSASIAGGQLTVKGTGFMPAAATVTAYLNGSPLATTVVSATELTASVAGAPGNLSGPVRVVVAAQNGCWTETSNTASAFEFVSLGCGGATLTPGGTSVLGDTITLQVGGSQPATLEGIWIGFTQLSQALCPNCTLGTQIDFTATGASLTLPVRNEPVLIGLALYAQGVRIGGASGGCQIGGIDFTLSETIRTLVGSP